MPPRSLSETSGKASAGFLEYSNLTQGHGEGRVRAIDEPALLSASRRINARGKRLFDVLAATALLALLAPLLASVALAYWLTGGPALVRERKIGRRGKPFMLWSFSADRPARAETPPHRALRRAIRAGGLADLPALANVVAGNLSLVGAPPVDRDGLESYGTARRYYLIARPGLVCPWDADDRAFAARCRDYVLGWRLRKDVRTLVRALQGRRAG